MQAASIEPDIEDQVTPTELLQLSKALYISGRLAHADSCLKRTLENKDPLIVFHSKLLRAQISFLTEKMADGRRTVDEALKALGNDRDGLSEAEIRLKTIEAQLTCASMQLALGNKKEAKPYIESSHEILQSLPKTTRTAQFQSTLESLMEEYVDNSPKKHEAFDEFEKRIREVFADSSKAPHEVSP